MLPKPVAPSVPATSTKPEDVQAWENYYAECEWYADMMKPCMDRHW